MIVKQLSVFLENRAGRVNEVAKVLAANGVDMLAFSHAESSDFGILRIITEDNASALNALRAAGYLSSEVELVGLEVPDKAGALSDLLIALGEGGVNVEYMYSYAGVDGQAKIALKTAAPQMAISVLEDLGAKIL